MIFGRPWRSSRRATCRSTCRSTTPRRRRRAPRRTPANEVGAFSGCDSLRNLTLWNNDLQAIASRTFDGAPMLSHLDLDNNSIATLETDAFADLDHLSTLDLRRNPRLSDLPASLLELADLRQVLVQGTAICESGAPDLDPAFDGLVQSSVIAC